MNYVDLTVSRNYVPGWRFWEGARELVQNAIDRERESEAGRDPVQRVMSEYRASISYDPENEALLVSNAESNIEPSTLLLGEGSKVEGGETIGQHGEGYKLALLALTRCGREVVVENGPDVWTCSFEQHETLEVDVLRVWIARDINPENRDLRFIVSNVSEEDWALLQRNVRRLHDSGEEWRGSNGSLLTEDVEMGRLYVGGLFVQELNQRYLYGYDFDPGCLKLDRDRQRVTSFDLNWEIGRLLAALDLQAERYVVGAMKESSGEIEYLRNHVGPMLDRANETIYREFREEFGEHAYPVDTEYRATEIRMNYGGAVKVVVVSPVIMKAVTSSKGFREWASGLEEAERQAPAAVLRDFLKEHREYFPQTLADAFAAGLIDRAEVEGWTL